MTIRLTTAMEHRRRVRRAVLHIEATLQARPDAALSLDELAGVACMSRWHFIRRYQDAVDEPPQQTVRRLRLTTARERLLTDPDASVTDAALELGYANAQAFSRAYTRQFGAPPSDRTGDALSPAPVTSLVHLPAIRMQAMRISDAPGSTVATYDEMLGHLDIGAVPRAAQDLWAVLSPERRFQQATVTENRAVRNALRLSPLELPACVWQRIHGQPQAVWRQLGTPPAGMPLLLRYVNDPAYRPLAEQRIALYVPLQASGQLDKFAIAATRG